MLKTVASVVLAAVGGSTYQRRVRLASSFAAASPDNRFEHPGPIVRKENPSDTIIESRWAVAVAGLILLAVYSGCVTPTSPEEFFQLSPESPKHRAMQTRYFETKDDRELLSASAAVLQDLGFQVEESVRDVGFLRATKERSAREYGQDIQRFVIFVLTTPLLLAGGAPVLIPVDLHQKIAATLVARPVNPDATRYEVRIMFYRVVWKGEGGGGKEGVPPGIQRTEMIREPAIYQQFFFKLSKAVFLEAFTL